MANAQTLAMTTYGSWIRWHFELHMFYDRAVAASSRHLSTWDVQLTAWQLRRGSVELASANGRLRAGPGDWVLIAPGTARRHHFSDDAVIRSIRCQIRDATGQPGGIGVTAQHISGGDDQLQRTADALAHVLPADWQDGDLALPAHAAMHGAVLAWCAAACTRLGIDGRTRAVDARVAAAQRLLLARRSPSALPWASLREATGLSRPQLDRLFRQASGRSVRAWAEDRLLADACAALADPAGPVKAVAADLGFGDASHFCRWFRQRSGASPADWRRRGGT